MKKILISKGLLLTFVGILMTSLIYAQADKSKRASPPETATGTVAGSHITINYSSPAVKGRKIWGDLVPYDKVWRLGANEAKIGEILKQQNNYKQEVFVYDAWANTPKLNLR